MSKTGLYSQQYAVCPWCSGHSGRRVDHLFEDRHVGRFGPWACDACHRYFEGTVSPAFEVVLKKTEESKNFGPRAKYLVLLRIDTKDGPLFLITANLWQSADESAEEVAGHLVYFYEEHECPTNLLRECIMIYANGSPDPHGFWQYVRSVRVEWDFDEDDDNAIMALFPELQEATR